MQHSSEYLLLVNDRVAMHQITPPSTSHRFIGAYAPAGYHYVQLVYRFLDPVLPTIIVDQQPARPIATISQFQTLQRCQEFAANMTAAPLADKPANILEFAQLAGHVSRVLEQAGWAGRLIGLL